MVASGPRSAGVCYRQPAAGGARAAGSNLLWMVMKVWSRGSMLGRLLWAGSSRASCPEVRRCGYKEHFHAVMEGWQDQAGQEGLVSKGGAE